MIGSVKVYEDAARRQDQDRLVLDHLEFVRQVHGRLLARLPPGVDAENLESAGILGLVEAARQFDPGRGTAFKTYAYPRIRGAMVDELRRNCPLPQPWLHKLARIRQAYEQLTPPVALEVLAQATGLSLQETSDCLDAMRLLQPEPWNDLLSAVRDRWHAERDDPSAQAELEEAKQILADGIEQLPERERLVLTLYYLEDLRLQEIAAVIQRSESQVSKLLSRAEFALKEYVQAREGGPSRP